MQLPDIRPSIARQSVHPSITAEQISQLVERFYGEVRRNSRLGPIFAGHLDGRWNEHLDKMKAFWRSVLLRSGEYKGQPVPAHRQIGNIGTDDFREWLVLFASTTGAIFEPDAAPLVNQAAIRIASSLWLACAVDPFASPPNWNQLTGIQSPETDKKEEVRQ